MNTPMIKDLEDIKLFVSLCEDHYGTMFAAARSILTGRNSCHVDDAVQMACMSIAKNIKMIKFRVPCSKRRSFIVTIVRNAAIDIIRKESRAKTQPLDDVEFNVKSDAPDPLDKVIAQEGHSEILAAIKALDESYRIVLELKLLRGLPDVEIGKLLNITPKNVNVRVFRAKSKLRKMLAGRN